MSTHVLESLPGAIWADVHSRTRSFALEKAEGGCNDAEKLIERIKRRCEKQTRTQSGETGTGSDSDQTERGSQAGEGSGPPPTLGGQP